MTSPRAGSSQGASIARSILKRRDKPYKTERSRVLAKKKKLDIRMTNQIIDRAGQAVVPQGFRFLPVGTPQLANRCRELSRAKGLPVNVVNAKPSNTHGEDPGKISFHIRRIGYHFRTEVVDQACRELNIVLNNGRFVKEDTLREEFQNTTMARAMAKLGLRLDLPREQKETHDQIRLAIQELFPKIPEEDLEAVIKVSWEEGSDKIGMHHEVSLARRIQLAVIARIRHVYTDYDQLLAAFKDWQFARSSVEKTCLEKLIEWRGENDNDAADDELEEIIRETIVIDDDDDVDSDVDDDSVIELDSGNASDTSLEISYTQVGSEDFRPESAYEPWKQDSSLRPIGRDPQFHNLDIRQKIGFVRQQKHNEQASDSASGLVNSLLDVQQERRTLEQSMLRVNINENHRDAESIIIDGRVYKKLNPPLVREVVDLTGEMPVVRHETNHGSNLNEAHYQVSPMLDQAPLHGHRTARSNPSSPRIHNVSRTDSAGEISLRDRPVPSIERPEGLYRTALISRLPERDSPYHGTYQTRAPSPQRGHLEKRRRLAEPTSPRLISGLMRDVHRSPAHHNHAGPHALQHGMSADVPNLRPVHTKEFDHSRWPGEGYRCRVPDCPYITSRAPSLERHMTHHHVDLQGDGITGFQASYVPNPYDAHLRINSENGRAPGLLARADPNTSTQAPDQYDPFHPLISTHDRDIASPDQAPRQARSFDYGPTDSQIAPIQYLSRGHGRQGNVPHSRAYGHPPGSMYPSGYAVSEPPGRRLIPVETPRDRYTPLPTHGAPALVQQILKSDQRWQPAYGGRVTEVNNTVHIPTAPSSNKALSTPQQRRKAYEYTCVFNPTTTPSTPAKSFEYLTVAYVLDCPRSITSHLARNNMPGSSIWLVPPPTSPLYEALQRLISQAIPSLFPLADSPHFTPHVTLSADGIPPFQSGSHDQTPQAWLDSIPLLSSLSTLQIQIQGPRSDQAYFRKLSLQALKTLELAELAAYSQAAWHHDLDAAHAWAARANEDGEAPEGGYGPHLSLM